MGKPKFDNANWVMTLTHVDSDGEQFWEVIPKNGSRPFVIHEQEGGLLYLSIHRGKEPIDRAIVTDALHFVCEMVYQMGVTPWIKIKPRGKRGNNSVLFAIAKKAGLRRPIHAKGSHLSYVSAKEK